MSRGRIIEHRTLVLKNSLIDIVSDECEYCKIDEVDTKNIIQELNQQFYSIIYDVIEKSMKERKHPDRVMEFLIGIGVGSVVVIVIELILWLRG